MAVRFSKLKTINLDNVDQDESEPTRGEDGLVEPDREMDDETKLIMEDDETTEEKGGGHPSWMFWRYRGSYSPLKQRRWRKCPCNSWKAVAIAVLIFALVFLISLIISALVPEPSEGASEVSEPSSESVCRRFHI